ncbi:HXXXD-type acyl-transferase family protein [Euphorbia peplus]|nr:HXXXD-type acyl-transferase family protein [Euphorbia peplus]
MEEVRLVSTTLMEALTNQEPFKNKLELTSSDLKLLLVGSIQKGLLFPKPNSSFPTLIQHLKTSFSLTLRFFYPLAGRLSSIQHQDNTISLFINCNNAGAQFVHAVAENITVSDILDPLFIPSTVHSFFPLTDILNYEGVSNPLLGVQITELSDGIFIGCTMNHAVADGTTFWNFMNSWSEISRDNGLIQISKRPVFENWFRDPNSSIRLPVSVINNSLKFKFIPPELKERVFHFSKDKLVTLKAKANSEVGMENSVVISSLQSVLAHIWRAVVRNRGWKQEQETKLLLQIGFRGRLHPEIPDGYFGNAIYGQTVTLKAREVIEKGLGFVALQINKMVSGYTEEKARDSIESWIKDPEFPTMSELIRDALAASSSPRFNVYGNDFGWGKPKAVRSGPGNKFDGKVTVFPGLKQGSMDIEVCVSHEVLEAMGKDCEFMNAITL